MVDERAQRPAFGTLLRARRIAAGFTQDELAERARISVQAVSALERGVRHAPRGDTLALLTRALELDGDALAEFHAAARASVKPKVRSTQSPVKPSSGKRAHLTQFGTPFVGRDGIARDVAAAVAGNGCTTLWGTGGVGKTRLAIETSALVEDRFERIAFASLAATIDDDSVDDAIASALGIARSPGEDVFARIVAELSLHRSLVIVDNCEHVVAGAARSVGALVVESPETAFVCTTREPLRIRGERVIGIGALDAEDAQRLFVDLAATVAPGGTLSEPDARDVATICRKLDGIPLALELAAACARVIDLKHVASGLDERFRLLTRGKRAATDRHTTLRATIAWSYDMLDASDRMVFERAAIVNGSFTLDDLLAIAVDDGCDRATVLDATATLVEKSLIVAEHEGTTARRTFRLLDSMRAFALEAAARNGPSALDDAYRRWGRHLDGALRRTADAFRAGAPYPLEDVALDHLRGYLDWAIEKRHDVAAGTLLAAENHLFWDNAGLPVEGIRRIEAGLALLPDDDAHAKTAMYGWYAICRLNQRLVRTVESLASALRAADLAARVGDDHMRASCAAKLAVAYDAMGERSVGLAYAREAVEVFERAGDAGSAAYNACFAAVIAFKIDGDEAAIAEIRRAVEAIRAFGHDRRTASCEMDLAEAYFAFGDCDAAIATIRSAIPHFRIASGQYELAIALTNLGAYLLKAGREAEALPVVREALEIGREHRYTRIVALAVQTGATLTARAGREPRRCVELLGFVTRRYGTIGGIGEIGFTETAAHDMLAGAAGGLLPATERADAMRVGAAFDDDAAVDTARHCIG